MTDPRRRTGAKGEEAAATHLMRSGWRILERNARTAFGEIDVIGLDGRTLVFVEVKSRRSSTTRAAGAALEGIGPRKQLQVRRLARAWLSANRPRCRYTEIRFDAIGVAVAPDGSAAAIEHIEGAF